MGEESPFFPNLGAMDVENLEGAGNAAKNLADRRFAALEGDIQMIIEMGMFDKSAGQGAQEGRGGEPHQI